jgi:tRNA-dihydrouridine synthase A
MRTPDLVGACIAAMKGAVDVRITVKCRIGVDEQDPEPALDRLADCVLDSGADAIWVHARMAWLQGLSPKENRSVPPLNYQRVYRLKDRLPDVFIGINGGIADLRQAREHLAYVDGVMLGRAAYQNPAVLSGVDELAGDDEPPVDLFEVSRRMMAYAEAHCAAGGRLSSVSRTVEGSRPGAGPEVIGKALDAVLGAGGLAEAA